MVAWFSLRRLRSAIVMLALLALVVCVNAEAKSKKAAQADFDRNMAAADSAVLSGNIEAAMANFYQASLAEPTRKEPWTRTAQLRFDQHRYALAIVAADEVIKRDPADGNALYILSVGGLRLGSEAVEHIKSKPDITNTERVEMDDLSRSLRSAIAEHAPPAPVVKRPVAKRPVRRTTPSSATAATPAPAPASAKTVAPAPAILPPTVAPPVPEPVAADPFQSLKSGNN